jgi:acylphosphatase
MTNEKDMLGAHVFITGRVQGVNFRWYTQREAQSLGVTGWIKNLSDGRVEAVFEGDSDIVHKIIAWCYAGHPSAGVDNVEVNYLAPTGEHSGFQIAW